MSVIKTLVCFVALFLSADILGAQTSRDIADYDIPTDAIKRGPGHSQDPEETHYNFFPPGSDLCKKPTPPIIGYEEFRGLQLVVRQLYRSGKKHGVQRTWHRNGQLASEAPYRDGVMDGIFRFWNKSGQLIAQYTISAGNGTLRKYSSDGFLIEEKEFTNNKLNGIWMEYDELSRNRSIHWTQNGKIVGIAYSFFSDDLLRSIVSFEASETMYDSFYHGPFLEFSADGAIRTKKWYVHNHIVNESTYATKVVEDTSLPPYYANTEKYKQLVTNTVKAALNRYRTIPRVKIPLELDQHGDPVLAPVQ